MPPFILVESQYNGFDLYKGLFASEKRPFLFFLFFISGDWWWQIGLSAARWCLSAPSRRLSAATQLLSAPNHRLSAAKPRLPAPPKKTAYLRGGEELFFQGIRTRFQITRGNQVRLQQYPPCCVRRFNVTEITQLFIRYPGADQRKILQYRKLGSSTVFEATARTLPGFMPPPHVETFAVAAIDACLNIFRINMIELAQWGFFKGDLVC